LIERTNAVNIACMKKTEILQQLPRLIKSEREELRFNSAKVNEEDWLDDNDLLTVDEKALLNARLAAYAKDAEAGSSWEEVENRIRDCLTRQPK
jgi:putative addiction module component (TIGR02574 family)